MNKPIITLLLSALLLAAPALASEPFSLERRDGTVAVLNEGKPIAVIENILLDYHGWNSFELKETAPGHYVLEALYLEVDDERIVEITHDHEVTVDIRSDESGLHLEIDDTWFSHVNIFLADLGGHMFGVKQTLEPYNQLSPDLRGLVQDVNAMGEQGRIRANYATAVSPMFFNTLGYVSYIDTFGEGRYRFAVNGRTDLFHSTRGLRWHLLHAPTLDGALPAYYALIGKPKYVPAWATGPVVWRDDHKNGKADVLGDTERLTQMRIPFTALFVDRPYSNGANQWSKMDFNGKFSNPAEWIGKLEENYRVKTMTWIAPLTFEDPDFPDLLAGFKGYFDLTSPEALNEFKQRITTQQYTVGVRGHKMDRADENFPVNEAWRDETPIWERRSKYIWLYAKHTHDMLTEAWGEDHFNFARAAVHGTQQHLGAIWAGDVRTSWAGLRANIANAIRASYQGFPNWGTDVGGYIGNTGLIGDELYLRWLQFGLYTGFFEIKLDGASGRGTDRAPWRYPESFHDEFRSVFEARMALIPYVHSLLNRADEEGTLMKPLAGIWPDDPETHAIWDQYLFGPALMVAPLHDTAETRRVYLPEGDWYDYYGHARLEGGRWIEVETRRADIPVFARANSLLVKGSTHKGNSQLWDSREDFVYIYFYPDWDQDSETAFVLLDGGQYARITASVENGRATVNVPELGQGGVVHILQNDGTWHEAPYQAGKAATIGK